MNKTHLPDLKIDGNKIIEKKLREMNDFLANIDLSTLVKPRSPKSK